MPKLGAAGPHQPADLAPGAGAIAAGGPGSAGSGSLAVGAWPGPHGLPSATWAQRTLRAEAKQIAAPGTYAAEHQLKFPLT